MLVAMVRDSEAMTRTLAEWATGQPMPADLQLRTHLDGRGTSVMRPTVIGPSRVPVVTDLSEPVRAPGVTPLSVIAHGRSEHAPEGGCAGLRAAESLDEPDATLYADMVLHHLGDCGFVGDGDVRDFCNGDCGFI